MHSDEGRFLPQMIFREKTGGGAYWKKTAFVDDEWLVFQVLQVN